jgi:hypothetical protein
MQAQVSFLRTLDKGIAQFEKFAQTDKETGKVKHSSRFPKSHRFLNIPREHKNEREKMNTSASCGLP